MTRTGRKRELSDLFGKEIDNPSFEKSHLLQHPNFKTHREEGRGREMVGRWPRIPASLTLPTSPGSHAGTEPFPAGPLLSRAISINPKITGWVGRRRLPFPLLTGQNVHLLELLFIVLTPSY